MRTGQSKQAEVRHPDLHSPATPGTRYHQLTYIINQLSFAYDYIRHCFLERGGTEKPFPFKLLIKKVSE